VRLLADGGADVNAISADGTTALTLACEYQRVDVVRALLERGAEKLIDHRTSYGNSPMV
jgi:uncharacterized protein